MRVSRQSPAAWMVALVIACSARAAGPTPEQRLAVEFMRAALSSSGIVPATPAILEIASILANEASALDPQNAGLWRLTLGVASLADRDDLRITAIENLSRLDPTDETIRLTRLNLALERYQTVEERLAAYEQLLSDETVARIGKPVASRLALDLALLKQREGDTDSFSRWLTRSLELDRSNRTAAAIAAGFFRSNVQDALGEAELLTTLVLADPTDVSTQFLLAQLLLENGAYAGADRVYRIAMKGLAAQRGDLTTELMADVAIAQWAAGDSEAAIATLDERQSQIDEFFRYQQALANRQLTMVELGALKGPVDPSLAMVAAAIHADRRDPKAADALAAALTAYDQAIKAASSKSPPADSMTIAGQHLEAAWMALWLGSDLAQAQEHLAAAEKLQPFSDVARQRFDGWLALRQGAADRAVELLAPLAETDAAARVGLALAMQQEGRTKDAALELLKINQTQPGSMIGIWASGELSRLVGQRVPLSKQAAEMERLIASIAQTFDRYARDSTMAVSLRITPLNPNPGPFEPMLLKIELTNSTNLPLAVDAQGPLRPQVLVVPQLNSAMSIDGDLKPFVVDLNSRLRLSPGESVSTIVDVRWYPTMGVLNLLAPTGGIVKLTAQSNFVATPNGAIVPGLYGMETPGELSRLDGVRKNAQWLADALTVLKDPAPDPEQLMLQLALACIEHRLQGGQNAADETMRGPLLELQAAMPDAFARLGPAAQAWVLSVVPQPMASDQILAMARKSDSRLVQIAYLLFHLTGEDDPMIDAARRSDDPVLRTFALRLRKQPQPEPSSAVPSTSSPATAAPAAPAASIPAGGAPTATRPATTSPDSPIGG